MDYLVISILIAVLLDLLFGDPVWMPHPVRWIGKLILKTEPVLRKKVGDNRLAGIILVVVVAGTPFLTAFGLIWIGFQIQFWVGLFIQILILYTCFAAYDLDKQSRKVYSKIKNGNMDQARINLSMIVGRDTTQLNKEEMARATIETVAENTVDGVISPLFFAVIGGAPLALFFKAVSTLDSMVGYNNEKFKNIGWASAKLDDLLNYLPARLARLFYPLAAWLCKLNGSHCWKIAWRDGHKSPSPNAGISEAAFAGALNIQLGGSSTYEGTKSFRPQMGDPIESITFDMIPKSITLMYFTLTLFLLFLITTRLLIITS